ncbi:MAG: leucine-rich repeat domain-containing protein [Bacteroidales bacterium]|nr:leucine-rich repeat domain-containing protein [Bacteroidales bacterium]
MRKIISFILMLFITQSVFCQIGYSIIPDTKCVSVYSVDSYGINDIIGTHILGGAKSANGSFFTADQGVQTKTQLGNKADKVLFQFQFHTLDGGSFEFLSGTECLNEIVKMQSSETVFNGGYTRITAQVGDLVNFMNEGLKVCGRFRILNYVESTEDLLIEILPVITYGEADVAGNLIIPKSIFVDNVEYTVTKISDFGFTNCTGIKSIIIPESVTSIGDYAFEDCTALSKITCFAVNPPEVDASSFCNYNGYLTIPCDNFEAYDIHPIWGSFKHIECISAESTELPKDEVVVEPEINEAVFSMPTNASANSYTLTIQNNGVTFCTLTFNSQGQLSNIDFSGNTLKASVEGYQFTVTGLSTATDYGYSFKALDKRKSVLKEYTGSFTTKNEDGTGGSSSGGVSTSISDVLKSVDIQVINNQIFVDGAIVPYVIDIQGKKITNKNLKAGVYFILIDGKTFSVSIQ